MNFLKKSSVSSDPAPSDAKPEITAPDWYTHAHSTITATISANLHCLQLWEQLNIRFLKLDRERQVVEAMQQHLEREREELDAYRIHLEEEKKALFDAANEFEQFKRKWYNDHGIDPDELERLKKEEEESKKRMQGMPLVCCSGIYLMVGAVVLFPLFLQ
ncbi:hypothetical protein BKA69DRAFT_1072901 [Paraphysoderma sedebokerense]|nr:hypothetical protein BKA69DRAFT_1072901 [Paraphysoderma sedebokerense]